MISCTVPDASEPVGSPAMFFIEKPGTSSQNRCIPGFRSSGIETGTVSVVILVISVPAPFPDITAHIINPEDIWFFTSDRMGFLPGVPIIPGNFIYIIAP
jgi:hypothetical protein